MEWLLNGLQENAVDNGVNFSRLSFTYFIAQHNGTIIGCAQDEDCNELTYAIEQDGSVRFRKNQGIWKDLSDRQAANLRYYAGRSYNRDVPTFFTRQPHL